MTLHKEVNFETEICEHLGANGWLYADGDSANYDRQRALFPADVLAWVPATQPKAWETLVKNHGELTEQDKLVYVNNAIKGKLLDSETLQQQAANNTKEQFANSPDLKAELLNAIMGALDAHTLMSTQALNSPAVQRGLTDILLNNADLWETLRSKRAG